MMGRHAVGALLVGMMLLAVLSSGVSASGDEQSIWEEQPFELRVLSNRADLISGGDALIGVNVPAWADASEVAVDVDGRDVTDVFAVGEDGSFTGLVTALTTGENVVTVRTRE